MKSQSKTLEKLKRTRMPDTCIICDYPLPKRKAGQPGRPRIVCRPERSKGCLKAYHAIYNKDRLAA